MTFITTIVLVIAGLGVLAVSVPIIAVALVTWHITIPVVGAYLGGWFGFFLGVGIDILIFFVWIALQPTSTKKGQ